MAQTVFDSVWHDIFQSAGKLFVRPRVSVFTGSIATACYPYTYTGIAMFCGASNAIYCNSVKLADLMKQTAKALGTDGDYAPIVVLAHELGHGVAFDLKITDRSSMARENLADCLAGVVTSRAERAGRLDPGDLQEGLFTLRWAGDPEYVSIHDPGAHGTPDVRAGHFNAGYRLGLSGCGISDLLKMGPNGVPPWMVK